MMKYGWPLGFLDGVYCRTPQHLKMQRMYNKCYHQTALEKVFSGAEVRTQPGAWRAFCLAYGTLSAAVLSLCRDLVFVHFGPICFCCPFLAKMTFFPHFAIFCFISMWIFFKNSFGFVEVTLH